MRFPCPGAGPLPAAPGATQEQPITTATDPTEPSDVTAEGTLAPPERAQNAFTYNPALAPEGAQLRVDVDYDDGQTEVELDVTGLLPNRGYAAHAHANPCGATGDAAGPHYQNQINPAATPENPSTDPAYANPQNEIWLDFRTDGEGDAEATTEVPFVFTDRAPGSIVIHEAEQTATEPGQAGTAGGRLACLTVPFA